MTDPITSEEAKRVLESPVFIEAFSNVREDIVYQLEKCPLDNREYQNQLVISLQVLEQVKKDIHNQIAIPKQGDYPV